MENMKYTYGFVQTIAAASLISVLSAAVVQASPLVFAPNNGAVFSDANPNGNALILATVVKPKNTGETPEAAGAFGGIDDPAVALQQSILSQVSAQINNQIFNCGANCKTQDTIQVNGNSILSYSTDVNGNLILSYNSPNLGTTTINLGQVVRTGTR